MDTERRSLLTDTQVSLVAPSVEKPDQSVPMLDQKDYLTVMQGYVCEFDISGNMTLRKIPIKGRKDPAF